MIVEDDLSSQQYYRFIFEKKYEFNIVSTIALAKKALEEHTYGIALVDFSLSAGENGLDLIRFIASEYGGHPLAIALTAHAFPHNKEDALKAGAVEFLTKPIMSRDLLATVEKYLGDSSQ